MIGRSLHCSILLHNDIRGERGSSDLLGNFYINCSIGITQMLAIAVDFIDYLRHLSGESPLPAPDRSSPPRLIC